MSELKTAIKYLLKSRIILASIIFVAFVAGSVLLYLLYAFLYFNYNLYNGQFIFNFSLVVEGLVIYIVCIGGKGTKYLQHCGISRKTLILSRAIVITIYFAVISVLLLAFQALIVTLRADQLSQFGFWGLIYNGYGTIENLITTHGYLFCFLLVFISVVNFFSMLTFGHKNKNANKKVFETVKTILIVAITILIILAVGYFGLNLYFSAVFGTFDISDHDSFIYTFSPLAYVFSFVWQYLRLKSIAV